MTKKERRRLRQKTIEEKGAKEFAEIKAKVKEQKRNAVEKHNAIQNALHIFLTCQFKSKMKDSLKCKPWNCPFCECNGGKR